MIKVYTLILILYFCPALSSASVGFEFLNPWPAPPETSPPADQAYVFPGVPESRYQGLDNYPEGMISYFDFPDGLGNNTHMWFTSGGRSFYMRGPDINHLSAHALEAGSFWSNSVLSGVGVMKNNTVAIGRFGSESLSSAVIAGRNNLGVRYRDSAGDWHSQVLETSPAPGSIYYTCVTVGDVNNDTYPDVVFGRSDGLLGAYLADEISPYTATYDYEEVENISGLTYNGVAIGDANPSFFGNEIAVAAYNSSLGVGSAWIIRRQGPGTYASSNVMQSNMAGKIFYDVGIGDADSRYTGNEVFTLAHDPPPGQNKGVVEEYNFAPGAPGWKDIVRWAAANCDYVDIAVGDADNYRVGMEVFLAGKRINPAVSGGELIECRWNGSWSAYAVGGQTDMMKDFYGVGIGNADNALFGNELSAGSSDALEVFHSDPATGVWTDDVALLLDPGAGKILYSAVIGDVDDNRLGNEVVYASQNNVESANKDASNIAIPVLSPTFDCSDYDQGFAGITSVLYAYPGNNPDNLIAFYHAEDHCWSDPGWSAMYGSIGMATSSDGGITWVREGLAVDGQDPKPDFLAGPLFGNNGVETPCVIPSPDGQYLYMYYAEVPTGYDPATYDPANDIRGFIALARAEISTDGLPGHWYKYKDGSFSEPGIGHYNPSPVIRVPGDYACYARVTYNTFAGKYIAVFCRSSSWWKAESYDGIHWRNYELIINVGQYVYDGGPAYFYLQMLDPSTGSHFITGQHPYLYMGYDQWNLGGWTRPFMARRPMTILAPTINPANIDASDAIVNFIDFAYLAASWLDTGSGLQADIYWDDVVDGHDLELMAENWLEQE